MANQFSNDGSFMAQFLAQQQGNGNEAVAAASLMTTNNNTIPDAHVTAVVPTIDSSQVKFNY